jgi:hypothetical protein
MTYATILDNALADYNAPNKVSNNLVIGGDLGTNPWQRGTTFTSVASASYTADRWRLQYVTSGVVTITRSSDAPTGAQAGILSTASLLNTVTTADASVAATDFFIYQYRIEGHDWSRIGTQDFTVSFWVKSSLTGTYTLAMTNSAATLTYVAPYTITNANTWEKKTIIVPAYATAVWNYTSGIGLNMQFCLMGGSNFTTSNINTWQATAFLAATGQVNFLGTIGNTFQIDLLQVELGNVATPFVARTEQEVLAACQRYFFKTFPQGVTPAQNVGNQVGCLTYVSQLAGVNSNGVYSRLPVTMRTAPTATAFNPNAANNRWRNVTNASDSGTPSTLSASTTGIYFNNPQVAGDAVGRVMAIHYTLSAEF